MKNINKTILTIDVLNILTWLESDKGLFFDSKFPIKLQWNMKKNKEKFKDIRNTYNEFYKKIQEKYSADKYSEEIQEKDGSVSRVVKNEYIDDFNKELNELLLTENEIPLYQFCIDEFGDINVDSNDIDMLSFFIINDTEEETNK